MATPYAYAELGDNSNRYMVFQVGVVTGLSEVAVGLGFFVGPPIGSMLHSMLLRNCSDTGFFRSSLLRDDYGPRKLVMSILQCCTWGWLRFALPQETL